jgi:hypothetical protein
MKKDLAKLVATIAFRSMGNIGDLAPLLKGACGDEEEYRAFSRAVARSAGEISMQIINHAISPHPEIAAEIEEKVKQYGRIF